MSVCSITGEEAPSLLKDPASVAKHAEIVSAYRTTGQEAPSLLAIAECSSPHRDSTSMRRYKEGYRMLRF